MIKAIVFDLAGVLYYPSSFKKFARKLHDRAGVSYKKIRDAHKTIWLKWKTGQISDKEAYQLIKKDFEISQKHVDWFRKAIQTEFWLNKSVYKVLPSLKDYRLFILSNNINEIVDPLRKKYKFDEIFEQLFISEDMKMCKPNKDIFQKFLKSVKLKAAECVFIDNEFKNISTAKSLGFKTIHYKNVNQFRSELENFI